MGGWYRQLAESSIQAVAVVGFFGELHSLAKVFLPIQF